MVVILKCAELIHCCGTINLGLQVKPISFVIVLYKWRVIRNLEVFLLQHSYRINKFKAATECNLKDIISMYYNTVRWVIKENSSLKVLSIRIKRRAVGAVRIKGRRKCHINKWRLLMSIMHFYGPHSEEKIRPAKTTF